MGGGGAGVSLCDYSWGGGVGCYGWTGEYAICLCNILKWRN